MKGKGGRPKSVDRGSERREFLWVGLTGIDAATRYCTVSWMRHGHRIAAVAQYRSLDGVDATYLGMAHGEIDGLLYRIGDKRAYTVLSQIGREPATQHDSVEALMTLAVLSLEQAVSLTAIGDVDDEDGEHKWVTEARAIAEGKRAVRS